MREIARFRSVSLYHLGPNCYCLKRDNDSRPFLYLSRRLAADRLRNLREYARRYPEIEKQRQVAQSAADPLLNSIGAPPYRLTPGSIH